jgi:hypothetical protein
MLSQTYKKLQTIRKKVKKKERKIIKYDLNNTVGYTLKYKTVNPSTSTSSPSTYDLNIGKFTLNGEGSVYI